METKKRIFIAFAIEDKTYRDFMVGQSRNQSTPFEFYDMSVKIPWDNDWKEKCRTKIKGCHGVIALISPNTNNASGQKFEIKTAYEEGISVKLINISKKSVAEYTTPDVIAGKMVYNWSWDNIKNFVNSL